MPEPQPHQLAEYVARRAQSSACLMGSLRQSLPERSDVWPIIDLVQRSAEEAHAACQRALEERRRSERLEAMLDLQRLARLAGPSARRVVSRLVHRLSGRGL